MPNYDFSILGNTGLQRAGGVVIEEPKLELRGAEGAREYRRISEEEPIVSGIFTGMRSLVRQVPWNVVPTKKRGKPARAAEFLQECLDDMSHPWGTVVSEAMSMTTYGWAYLETVYKRRGGESDDPTKRSAHADGKIGWRKLELRGQDTLLRWELQGDGGVAGMHQWNPTGGAAYIPIEKALLFRTESHKNNPEGRSLLRSVYRATYFKRALEEIEATGAERELKGVPVLEIPPEDFVPNADEALEKARQYRVNGMQQQAVQLANSERKYIVMAAEEYTDPLSAEGKLIKSGYKLSLLSSGGTRTFNTDTIIRRHRQDIAIGLMSQFVLLGMDSAGTQALSTDLTDMYELVIRVFLDEIKNVMNRFAIPRLMRLNGFPRETWPTLEYGEIARIALERFMTAVSQAAGVNALTVDAAVKTRVRTMLGLPPEETSKEPIPADPVPEDS